MKKIDYLIKAITHSNIYENKYWYIDCFSILVDNDLNDQWKNNPIRYRIVKKIDKLYFIDIGEDDYILVPIDDSIVGEPLFRFNDEIEVNESICLNVKKPIKTKIGNLIINKLFIVPCFNDIIEFIDGPINVSRLESIIVPLIDKTPGHYDKPQASKVSLKSFIEFVDKISFLENISEITVLTATEKALTVSPDFHIKKKEIYEKYKDKLTNPVEVINYEKELMEIDKEYLKDDPTYGKILKGKILNVARKKMFLSYGDERGFEKKTKANPITTSLSDGWQTNETVFKDYINALRSGSYSRGAETVKGGVLAKVLLRSIGGLSIDTTPCNTSRGLKRVFNNKNYTRLIDRYIKENNKWLYIEDDELAKQYIDKEVEVRSPMYCTAQGDKICYMCMSEQFKINTNGITTLSLEVSDTVLYMFMQLMHGVALENVKVDINDILT